MSGPARDISRRASLARLRQAIAGIEQQGPSLGGGEESLARTPGNEAAEAVQDEAALLCALLFRPGLHEVTASYEDRSAAQGFAMALLAGLEGRGAVLWAFREADAREWGAPYGPGLAAFGLGPERLLFFEGRKSLDVLGALEEGLKSGALAGVLGEAEEASLTGTRRLSLAAMEAGRPCFLLRPAEAREGSAARTRVRLRAAPSAPHGQDAAAPGAPRFQVSLEKAKGEKAGEMSKPFTAIVEWDHETHHFHLAAPLSGRTLLEPEKAPAGGSAATVLSFAQAS